jgi:hypothetical protein
MGSAAAQEAGVTVALIRYKGQSTSCVLPGAFLDLVLTGIEPLWTFLFTSSACLLGLDAAASSLCAVPADLARHCPASSS